MDGVTALSERDRRELFEETAARLGLRVAVIEKDFWVCWTLHRLFGKASIWPKMLFKGGTSLSKGYRAIDRFSEDIDLSLDRHDLGFIGESDPLLAPGKNNKQRLVERLDKTCKDIVVGTIFPALNDDFGSILGKPGNWSTSIEQDSKQTNILFGYPSVKPGGEYLKPVVIMEFGATSDHDLVENVAITSFSAEQFPDQFAVPSSLVKIYKPTRTFWEKATILHLIYHRNDPNKVARMSRHYYDVVMLARGKIGQSAMEDFDLLRAVARHKEIFFRQAAARYDEAVPGTLRLVPPTDLLGALKADYEKMGREGMFYGGAPSVETMMDELRDIEDRINSS